MVCACLLAPRVDEATARKAVCSANELADDDRRALLLLADSELISATTLRKG